MCLTEYDEAETMQMFKKEGIEEGIRRTAVRMLKLGKTVEDVSESCDLSIEQVMEIKKKI